MTDVGSLLTILQSGSRPDVVRALSNLTETERTRLGPTLRRSLNDGSGDPLVQISAELRPLAEGSSSSALARAVRQLG
ncbi:hypothetical protein [Cellulomonas soli]